jgi:Peptidase A4 family
MIRRNPFKPQGGLRQLDPEFRMSSGASPGWRLRRCARRRMRGLGPVMVSVLALVATAGGLVGSASQASANPPTATISSVSFGGTKVAPTITINGSGFGTSAPGVAPANCFVGQPASGNDYQNNLNLTDVTGGWYAGSETDCVTLTNVSYGPTRVTYQLGGFYGTNGWVLNDGDTYKIDVAGATATGTVAYPPEISSVSFGGTSVAPTITINGSNFGAIPASTPAGCDDPSGDNNYGNNLYIVDNTKEWNAGNGAACIGLTNVSYANTQVVFDLGPLYGSYATTDWVLDPGDNVTLHVGSATFTTTVSYPTTISSVNFTGWKGNPTITINGSDFGPTPPLERAGCAAPSGDNDYYNDDLYIVDNTGNWTSGEPGACVGITNVSYTNTQVVLKLGALYGSSKWVLNPGDKVTVYVAGASATSNVEYPTFAPGSVTNSSWAGYVDTAETYTHVSGTWTVPNASCGLFQIESSATWVGIDGANESVGPEQIGTDSNCAVFGGEYHAWYEMAPNGPALISNINGSDTVGAGDVMNGLVQYAGTNASGQECYDLQIQDQTRGWTFSTTQCIAGALGGTAEWIEEDPDTSILGLPSLPLAPFGSVTFTNCHAGGSDAAVYGAPISYHPNTAWIMPDTGGAAAGVSPLSEDGTAFTVNWQHS